MRAHNGSKRPAGKAGSLHSELHDSANATTMGRFTACLTPTELPSHSLCRNCSSWVQFGRHIRAARSLARVAR